MSNSGAFGEGFPYSNFHEMNMDWIVKIAKDFLDQYTNIQNVITQGETSLNTKTSEGLTSLNNKTSDGLTSLQSKATQIEELLNSWYTEHSEELAEALRNALEDIEDELQTSLTSFNQNVLEKTNEFDTHAEEIIETLPEDFDEVLENVAFNKYELEHYNSVNLCDYQPKTSKTENGITFTWNGGVCHVSGTATAVAFSDIFISTNTMPTGIEAGKQYCIICPSSKAHFIVYNYSGGTITKLVEVVGGWPKILNIPNNCTGLIIRLWVASGTTINEYVTPKICNNFRDWDNVTINTSGSIYANANDVATDNFCYAYIYSGQPTMAGLPYYPAWVETRHSDEASAIQIIYPAGIAIQNKNVPMYRIKNDKIWYEWHNITERGYVESVDSASASESGKTDMRAIIQYNLDQYGYCKLGTGSFYISNRIEMPDGSCLEGSGDSTELRLMAGTGVYAINMNKNSTVSNMTIIGNYTDLSEDDFTSTSGNRYGIMFRKGGGDYTRACSKCYINNVTIKNFNASGLYQYETSQNVADGLSCTNVNIKNCWCGIYNYEKSEFSLYTNVNITYCYHACILGSGNCYFNNCVFHSYNTGLHVVGSRSNSAHSVCSNSAFCHSGNNSGKAIHLEDVVYGFVVSNCQFWYNSIDIEDSEGIVFSSCEIARNVPINITNGNTVSFNGCSFNQDTSYPPQINITNNTKVHFNNCYGSQSGNAITP